MDCAIEKLPTGRTRRARLYTGMLALVLGTAFTGTACIIIPVPSVTPDYREGIIEDETLESLVGLDQAQVNDRIGYPDYSGRRGASYAMVYQGETRHSTEVYAFVSTGYTAGGGKIDEGTSKTLHCQVLELDANRIVRNYEVIVRPFVGITRRQDSDYVVEPASDCTKVVWGQSAQIGGLPGQIEATKKDMLQREQNEARRIANLEERAQKAELEHRARQGDTQAVIALTELTGQSAPLKALADSGDPAAAYAMYRLLSDDRETTVAAWKYLCSAANSGDAGAQSEVGYWHRQDIARRVAGDQLASIREEVGIRASNRVAYAWYTLAAAGGDTKAESARQQDLAPSMTPAEIVDAQRIAGEWKPGDCPSADNRLPPPDES